MKDNLLNILEGIKILALSDFNEQKGHEDFNDEDDAYWKGYFEALKSVKRNAENQ